jgi:uncharacterized protein with HEPN domain
MLRFVQELRGLAQGHTLESFTDNRVLCLATEKLFINVGEAANRIDEQARQSWPQIPWRRVIGLRNILAHGYEQVAHEILWRTIIDDLPDLEAATAQVLRSIQR